MPKTMTSYFFSAQWTYVRLSATFQDKGIISFAYPLKILIWRDLESRTASQQKKGWPIFSSICMEISSNLFLIREPLFTGVKSSLCMTAGT